MPRIGIGDDARAGTEAHFAALDFGAADQDVEIQIAVEVQPAECAGVGAARLAFQLSDDLHAAHLGATGDGAAGEGRADHRARRDVGAQPAAHVADDVVHVGVAFHAHQFVDLHAAGFAHAAQVVALQVDQHHVLGALLRVADQLADARGVIVACEARPGAGDGPGFHHVAAHRHQPLRRRAHHRPPACCEQARERRGIGGTQSRIQRSRIRRPLEARAPDARQVDLEYVACGQVIQDAPHAVGEALRRVFIDRLRLAPRGRRRRPS